MSIKYYANNTTQTLNSTDSTDVYSEIGIPICTHIVGSLKVTITGQASYNQSGGVFISPRGNVELSCGNNFSKTFYTGGRGTTLFIINPDFTLRNQKTYDTYANGTSDLVNDLLSVYKNCMYILASQDTNTIDSDLNTCLKKQFGCTNTTTYSSQRKGFAFIYAGGSCAYSISSESSSSTAYTTLTRYLASTNYEYSNMSTSEQANTYSFSIHNNITYSSSKTYHIRVRFRTRGNGNISSSKCSSVGFITWNSGWSKTYSYIHNSSTAYNERGRIIDWTYSFTPSSDFVASDSALFFIIGNGWANGYDNQIIDLYYYCFWSIDNSNVYSIISEKGYPYNSSGICHAPAEYFLASYKNGISYTMLHAQVAFIKANINTSLISSVVYDHSFNDKNLEILNNKNLYSSSIYYTAYNISKTYNTSNPSKLNLYILYAVIGTATSGSMSSDTGYHTYTLYVTFSTSISKDGINKPTLNLSWSITSTNGMSVSTDYSQTSYTDSAIVYKITIAGVGGNPIPGKLLVAGNLIDTNNNVTIGSFSTYTDSDWYTSSSSGGSSSGGGGGSGRE